MPLVIKLKKWKNVLKKYVVCKGNDFLDDLPAGGRAPASEADRSGASLFVCFLLCLFVRSAPVLFFFDF